MTDDVGSFVVAELNSTMNATVALNFLVYYNYIMYYLWTVGYCVSVRVVNPENKMLFFFKERTTFFFAGGEKRIIPINHNERFIKGVCIIIIGIYIYGGNIMKELVKNRKNKLVKSLMLAVTMLVTATMITSAAGPTALTSTQMNMNIAEPAQPVSAPATSLASDALAIKPVTPVDWRSDDRYVIFDNGLPDSRNGLSFGTWTGYERELCVDFTTDLGEFNITGGAFRMLMSSGGGPSGITGVTVYFYNSTLTGGPNATAVYTRTATFTAVLTGAIYFSRPEILVTCTFDYVYLGTTPSEVWWVQFQPAVIENAFWLTAAANVRPAYMYYADYTFPKWTNTNTNWPGANYDMSCTLTGTKLLIAHDVGVDSINAPVSGAASSPIAPKVTVTNYGNNIETFNMNVQIQRFLTPTSFYSYGWEDSIAPIYPHPVGTWNVINQNFRYSTDYFWTRYSGSTYAHTGTYSAALYTYSTYIPEDYLVTPQITVALDTVFSFWSRSYSTSYPLDDLKVAISKTGNSCGTMFTIAPSGVPVDTIIDMPITYVQHSYTLANYVPVGSTVYVALYQLAGMGGYRTFVDDIACTGSGTTFSEGFELAAWTPATTTPAAIPTWWTNTLQSGTYLWTPQGAGYLPTFEGRHEGQYMLFYNSYSASSGYGCRVSMNSNPINFAATGLSQIIMKIWNYKYTSGSLDTIQVQASTSPSGPWTNCSLPFTHYSTTLGWAVNEVDLSAFAASSTVYLAFLSKSLYSYNMYIDDFSLWASGLVPGGYNQDISVANLASMETRQITCPNWISPQWQNPAFENIAVVYNIKAAAQLGTDMNTANDMKTKDFTLTYPYLHDMQTLSIDSPITSGPAVESYPVKMTVKNIGQYPERGFFSNVKITGGTYVGGYDSNFDGDNGRLTAGGGTCWEWGVPTYASGPTAHSGTKLWGTILAGTYLPGHYWLDTPVIKVPIGADLTWWQWFYMETSYDGGNIKYSLDGGTTWVRLTPIGGYTGTANSANPLYPQPIYTGSYQTWAQKTIDLGNVSLEGQKVQFRFDFGADPSVNYAGWYIDDLKCGGLVLSPTIDNYDEIAPISTYIYPGESRQLTFSPDFEPANMSIGISGTVIYSVVGNSALPGDTHTANDIGSASFQLTYTHDVKVKDIQHPPKGDRALLTEGFEGTGLPTGWLAVDNDGDAYNWDCDWTYTPHAGLQSAASASYINYVGPLTPDNWLITPALNTYGSDLTYWHAAQDAAYAAEHVEVWVSTTGTTVPGDFTDLVDEFTETSSTWSQRTVDLSDYDGQTIYIAFRHCEVTDMYWEKIDDVEVTGGGGGGAIDLWLNVGTYPIATTIQNLGVFGESDLNVTAQIFFFNPNATLVYSDYFIISSLAAGAEQIVTFDSWTVNNPGSYLLRFEVALANDDVPANNIKEIDIGIDTTPPVTTHALTPASPNGLNGWYNTAVKVKLTATDTAGSGVQKIEYKINSGSWLTYTAEVPVSTEGPITFYYRATDKVGNVETPEKSTTFKIDLTKPVIAMNYTWEKVGTNQYDVTVTATCSDAISGMDRVMFYYNDALQETVNGTGPTFVWIYRWAPLQHVTIKGVAYDKCGWSDFAILTNITSQSQNQPQSQPQSQNQPSQQSQSQTVTGLKQQLGR